MLNLFHSKKITGFSVSLLLAAAITLLAGCGGGGSGTPGGSSPTPTASQAITGTVATGAPLAGATVNIKDSAGKVVTGATAANGTFGIAVTGMQPPFMLVAIKAGEQNMYSVLPAMDMASTNTQNVNITPVTTLVMYELNGGSDPALMYTAGSFGTITAAGVNARQTFVRSRLPANAVNPIFDMMYDHFVASVQPAGANPDPYDAALDSIGKITGITAASVTFSVAPPYTAGSGAVAAPSIALTLTDPVTSAPVTSVSSSSPARVTATVTNASGTVAPGVIVTFSTSDPRDTFSGGANTALTNSSGVATATLTTSNTAGGASTVTASASIGGTIATKSLNYAIGSSTITLSALTLPSSLSAYGTASVSVNVLNNGAPYTSPMTVSFTSACAGSGKATLTATVTTVNGTATANYLDNGCNNPSPGDTITATLMNGVTSTGNLPVSSPSVGSIQFVSVVTNPVTNPPMITIKGTGGVNRSETARVTFRVVDSAGNPLGNALVNFSLNTAPGGLTVYPTSATSDPVTGNVVTNVTSGIYSTAVRVTAKTGTISSQSDQLLISTGIPAQDAFSISASTHNIEAWAYDGVTTTLTARLADHFHNPVVDGTAVYFTTEGGSVVPSCMTVGGVCSVVLTSQELRPKSVANGYGRATVLVRATGEEAFIDLENNGVLNGTVDDYLEMIDANVNSTDMGEAYSDYNENNCRDPGTEPYVDFNGNGVYDGFNCGFSPGGGGGDGKYNGLLCTPGAAICSAQKSIDVRGSQIIIFSDSWGATPASLLSIYDPDGSKLAAYNSALSTYRTALTTYSTALGTYQAALTVYNNECPTADAASCTTAVKDTYNAALAVYNTALAAYQTAAATFSSAIALYNPPPIAVPSVPAGVAVPVIDGDGDPIIVLPSCTTVRPEAEARPATATVTVVDTNGNALPAGTVVTFTTDTGATANPSSWVVPDTIGCRTGFPGCPALVASPTFGDIAVTLMSDAAYDAKKGECKNLKSGGSFFVRIISPKGAITTYQVGITD